MAGNWWKEAVVYQIYPRSFMDSNGDGIGDLNGIISKLDYLKYLGIDVIWLSPVYKSPNDDNGYDISDYQAIMDEFGTMEDFDRLLAEAHERGIRIVMDLVVNHTSDEHRWFIESRSSKDNPYRDHYIWRDGKEGQLPNNWRSSFSGPAWEYDERTEMYYLHMFSKKQPDLNWENPKVRQDVFDMMTWWCDRGIDGFRMDVISMISKPEGLPDVGDDVAFACANGPKVNEYLREMNEKVLSRYDIMTVGETPSVTTELAKQYAGEDTHELNMVFQFEHTDVKGKYGKWTDERIPLVLLKRILSRWQTELYGKAWNSLYWDNHDQPRAVSRFGDDRPQYRVVSAKMLAVCLHMMQGTPYIYQGEEFGMKNYPFRSLEEFRDIESINAYKEWCGEGKVPHELFWPCLISKSRDNARTPVQWDDTENAGFTTGKPWMAVNPDYKEINAKAAQEDEDSIFHFYRKLISLRKQYPVIVYGRYELLLEDSEELFVYTRTLEEEELLVVCSFSDQECGFTVPEGYTDATCLIANIERPDRSGQITLKPYEAFVLHKKSHKKS